MKGRAVLVALLLLAAPAGAEPAEDPPGTVYTWQDASGQVHITSEPPPAGAKLLSKTSPREDREPAPPTSSPPAQPDPERWLPGGHREPDPLQEPGVFVQQPGKPETRVFVPAFPESPADGDFTVRVVYFVPKGAVPDPRAGAKLNTFFRMAQTFFTRELRGRTFRVEEGARRQVKVHLVHGEHDEAWYGARRDGDKRAPEFGQRQYLELRQRLAPEMLQGILFVVIHQSERNTFDLHYASNRGGGLVERGVGHVFVSANVLEGLAPSRRLQLKRFADETPTDFVDAPPGAMRTRRALTRGELASLYFGTALHELGHSLGLQHDFTDPDGDGVDVNLMGHGWRRFRGRFDDLPPKPATRLSDKNRRVLLRSPQLTHGP